MLRAQHLHFAFGAKTVVQDVSFELPAKARVALVGKNGAGKSTLLKLILNELQPDSGLLERQGEFRIGALAQRHQDPPGFTVAAAIEASLGHVRSLENQMRALELHLHEPTQSQLYSQTVEAFERLGGYSAPARAAKTVAGLALEDFLRRDASSLSGGERTRLALACALIGQPELLILDEPTNHLDIAMREWLEQTLRDYPGAWIAVSHDRELLDATAKQTWWLEHGSLQIFKGGYSSARNQRELLRTLQTKKAKLSQREDSRLNLAAKQVAYWGKNNDKLARRAKAIAARAERVRQEAVAAPSREQQIAMSLLSGDARAKLVLRCENVFKSFGTHIVLKNIALRLRAGDRVAVLAPNGAGKSTLLKILIGEIWPDTQVADSAAAEIRFGDGVLPAYFDQHLHGLQNAVPIFAQLSAKVGDAKAKALLGRYGFKPDDWQKLPSVLSGGEAARAGLALVAATRSDVLILDEPTNHLDVETVKVLEAALLAYSGSIVFVTHDRRFAAKVATRVMAIENGELLEFARGFSGYAERKRIGGQTEFFDPGRLLDFEIDQPTLAPEKPETELNRLEKRWQELDNDLLLAGISARETTRLRQEAAQTQARIWQLQAMVFAAPQKFKHFVMRNGLCFCSDDATGNWRFFVDEIASGEVAGNENSCPELLSSWHEQGLKLFWNNNTSADWSTKTSWFKENLVVASVQLAIERIGATKVVLPTGENILAEDHAENIGLLVSQQPTRHKAKWHTHADYFAWAAWQHQRKLKRKAVISRIV